MKLRKSSIAVIPARSGSKRLPKKNIRLLHGLPLIAWTINAAISSRMFDEVLVSTDDPEIADISRQYGASVPWLRPTQLSTDTSTSVEVVLHAINQEETRGTIFEYVTLLQPTSPFRSPKTIKTGLHLYQSVTPSGAPVVAVSPAKTHPALCFKLNTQSRLTQYCDGEQLSRSQDLPPAFEVNGAFYASSVRYLKNQKTFFGADAVAFVMSSPVECIDIDDEWDWQLATWIASSSLVSGNSIRK